MRTRLRTVDIDSLVKFSNRSRIIFLFDHDQAKVELRIKVLWIFSDRTVEAFGSLVKLAQSQVLYSEGIPRQHVIRKAGQRALKVFNRLSMVTLIAELNGL